MATNGTTTTPKITLYTNHRCPYAHRAHIALAELSLPFSETLIDLETPRPQWYLDINPRGLVPAMAISTPGGKEEIITESSIVATFLADAYPGKLLPAADSNSMTTALARARINFALDSWSSKVANLVFPMIMAPAEAKAEKAETFYDAVVKEIEPLLPPPGGASGGPFFGGKEDFTLFEVMLAPFVMRVFDVSDDGEVVPTFLAEKLAKLEKFGPWAEAVRGRESAKGIYDAKAFIEGTKQRIAKMAAKV